MLTGSVQYQRVSDGQVERFLRFLLQSFNKLKVFWILRLQVGQHLHTLTDRQVL